jgi:hypothetical protein
MRTKLTVATALAGTLLATCLVSGPAQATYLPVLKDDTRAGIVTLVRKGGGGGGGGKHARGGGGGGGKHARGGGGGGGKHARGGGGKRYGGGGDGNHYAHKGGGKRYGGGGDGKHYANKDHGKKDHGDTDRNKRHAMKDRDHRDHGNIHRHRVFRNGAWVWVYGSGYTAYGGDCYWLQRQAIITGSPYWWDRYYACVSYDYY